MMVPGRLRILICGESVDFRKSFDGLCGVVRNELGEDPQRATLFVFCNKRRDQLRLLWWDRNGFAIWMKRLERGVFEVPRVVGKSATLSSVQLAMLLEGAVELRRAA